MVGCYDTKYKNLKLKYFPNNITDLIGNIYKIDTPTNIPRKTLYLLVKIEGDPFSCHLSLRTYYKNIATKNKY